MDVGNRKWKSERELRDLVSEAEDSREAELKTANLRPESL
jgi:hypothetical protein